QRIHPFIVANLPGGYKGRTAEKPPAAGRKNAPPPAGKAAPGRPPRQPLFCPLGPAGCKKSPGGFTKRKKDSTIEKQAASPRRAAIPVGTGGPGPALKRYAKN